MQGTSPDGVRKIYEAGRDQGYLDDQAGRRKNADPDAEVEAGLLKRQSLK
jgi:hypothetical protein